MLRYRLVALLVLAALVGACGAPGPATQRPGGDGAATPPSATSPVADPTEAAATVEPSGESPPDTPSPTGSPSPDATAEPTASIAPSAAACTGNAANREFLAGVAEAVRWPVLCAVLPKGWFVNSGRYRLANGGWMVISYKGPGGATLALSEGSFCKDADGCVPAGTDAGDAEFGRLDGTLVELDGGGFAIVVDRGATPSWLLETHGLDQAATVSLGAALHEVGGQVR